MSVQVDMSTGADWRELAVCRSIGPEPFDTPDDMSSSALKAHYDRARVFCESCPVQYECLASALNEEEGVPRDERQGVRGGFGPRARYNQGPFLLERVVASR